MHVNEYEYYISSTNKLISQLLKQKTWEWVNPNDIPTGPDEKNLCIFKANWAFKLKQLTKDSPIKYKTQYCVRRYLQIEGVEFF